MYQDDHTGIGMEPMPVEMLDAEEDHTGRAEFWCGAIMGWASGVLFAIVMMGFWNWA